MTEASKLKNYFYRLYLTFLEKHMKATSLKPTSEEEDCVKAFCVLSHAALEEYFELLAANTLNDAYIKYKSKSIISALPKNQKELDNINLGIVQLIETLILSSNFSTYSSEKSDALKEHKSKLERVSEIYNKGNSLTVNDMNELTKKTDSYTKEILKETKVFFKRHIESNNGASLKYLIRLLIPVGIDIPNDIRFNSLQQLAKYRGDFAHSKGLSKIVSASDVIPYIKDIVELCKSIENSIDDFKSI